jgi:YfiH family protein
MFLFSQLLANSGFAHAFPTRGAVDGELRRLIGTDLVVQVRQVHGGRAVEAAAATGEEADALVARAFARLGRSMGAAASTAVGVRVADCVPLLLADQRSGDVAAVHAGWRGVVAGVVPNAMDLLGGGSLVAAIGPCIGACCFEVGRDVGDRIARACGDATVIVREAGDKVYVDLQAAVRAQLRARGLADTKVDALSGCTKHEHARFHSYRRDGAGAGRMLAAIATRR